MKNKLNTLDKVLIVIALFLLAFTVATMIIYTVNGWQFDTLITCFLGLFGGIEPIVTGVIQISKYKHKKGDEEDES